MFSNEISSCDLTLEDCNKILTKYLRNSKSCNNAISFTVTALSKKITGYMGKHLILRITYKNLNNELETGQFFLKSITGLDNPYVKYFPDAHKKEIGMYEFLETYNNKYGTSLLCDVSPKLYLNDIKSETIVLEDLSLRGFRMHDPHKKYVDKNHMMTSLKALAKLHAASFVYEDRKTKEIGRKFCLIEEFGQYLEEITFSRSNPIAYKYTMCGVTGLIALTDIIEPDIRLPADRFKRQILLAVEKLFRLLEDTETYRCVITHGDLWARNLLFNYDDENNPLNCQFVDYQFLKYAPPAFDVTVLIYHSLEVEDFEHYYQDFLNYYYGCLKAFLMEAGIDIDGIYLKEGFLKSCEEYLFCSKLMLGIYRTLSAVTEETYIELCKDPKQFEHVLIGDRTDFAIKHYKGDANYRKHLKEIMDVIRNMILEDLNKT